MLRALALVLCLAPHVGLAQSSDAQSSDAQSIDAARRLSEIGRASYERGEFADALRYFESARRVKAAPAFDFNIARCHERLGNLGPAVEEYERYLATAPPPTDLTEELQRRGLADHVRALRSRPRTPAERAARRRGLIVASAIGGGALILAAVGSGLLGRTAIEFDDLRRSCGPCPEASIERVRGLEVSSYAVFGVAGALAITDVVLWATRSRWSAARPAKGRD